MVCVVQSNRYAKIVSVCNYIRQRVRWGLFDTILDDWGDFLEVRYWPSGKMSLFEGELNDETSIFTGRIDIKTAPVVHGKLLTKT